MENEQRPFPKHTRGYEGNNRYIIKFIREIYQETGIHPHVIWSAIYHFLTWQWRSFNQAEFMEYIWDRCFVFKFFNRRLYTRLNKPEAEIYIRLRKHHKDKVLLDRGVSIDNISEEIKARCDELASHNDPLIFHKYLVKTKALTRTIDSVTYMIMRRCYYHRGGIKPECYWNKSVLYNLEEQYFERLLELIAKANDKHDITKAQSSQNSGGLA